MLIDPLEEQGVFGALEMFCHALTFVFF